ncbi:MAG: MotA/TolQ/ExbB proton channel family protein [Solirubrobacteraceae bacterium]|nr:MotA/TolQ/ExbB proton channel family protein [Solirubrobacteraceae bacterium]
MTTPLAATADAGLGEALSQLVGYLQLPVLIAALVMLLLTVIELGRLATELLRRYLGGSRATLEQIAVEAIADPARAGELSRGAPSGQSAGAVRALADRPDRSEAALTDYEHAVQRRLDRTRLLVRGGPAVGLMGTLIPLAPGLTELGKGNIPALTDELRTAFAATVIGILIGTVSFAITLTRARLYSEDLTALERAVETAKDAA